MPQGDEHPWVGLWYFCWQTAGSLSHSDSTQEALFSPANELFKPLQVVKNEQQRSKRWHFLM